MNLIYEEESYKIRGTIYEVYKEKGSGFLEPVYQECLDLEFKLSQIPAVSQPYLNLYYKGYKLNKHYTPDFICYDKIVIEIKAVEQLVKKHESQLLNYLHATGFKLGFLVNFGNYPKVEIKRIVL